MKKFYYVLAAALIAVTTSNFVWFALTYWAYLTTKSVISTSIVAGIWLVSSILSSNWFGSIVDHSKKKNALIGSSIATFIFFSLGLLIYNISPENAFVSVTNVWFWLFVFILIAGVIAASMYNIAVPTLVAFIVPEEKRAQANGLFGTVLGISFAITSVTSGFALAFGSMSFVLIIGIIVTLIALAWLSIIPITEKRTTEVQEAKPKKLDIKGTIKTIKSVPGLFSLIFFAAINNFLGGVFFALMDAYGLTLVSVQIWGLLWGFLSIGFILGGLYIAKKKDSAKIQFIHCLE